MNTTITALQRMEANQALSIWGSFAANPHKPGPAWLDLAVSHGHNLTADRSTIPADLPEVEVAARRWVCVDCGADAVKPDGWGPRGGTAFDADCTAVERRAS